MIYYVYNPVLIFTFLHVFTLPRWRWHHGHGQDQAAYEVQQSLFYLRWKDPPLSMASHQLFNDWAIFYVAKCKRLPEAV
jgi:hypothetical protein